MRQLRPDSREFTPQPQPGTASAEFDANPLQQEPLTVPALVNPQPGTEASYAPMPPMLRVPAMPPPPESLHIWQQALVMNDDLRRYVANFPTSTPPYLYTLMANQQLILRQLAAFLCFHYPTLLGSDPRATHDDADYLQQATILQSFASQMLNPVPFATPLPDAPRWLRIPSRLCGLADGCPPRSPSHALS
jgi:hypothetical protein